MAGPQPKRDLAAQRPIDRLLSPIQDFLRIEAAGGLVLLACTVVAMIVANSPWAAEWSGLWATKVTVAGGPLVISKPLLLWINDGLMAVFFFVVGLEIKRELLAGELSTPRQATLPLAAAAGGMLVPSLIYVACNLGGDGLRGWAIPAATDIAFALGVMALLGKRVPVSLKIFLTALAIVDDIGAVLVIAAFYTSELSGTALAVAGAIVVLLVAANRLHVRAPLVYALLGACLWVAVLKSGLHATVAGVILAFTVPARVRLDAGEFAATARDTLGRFEATGSGGDLLTDGHRRALVQEMETVCEHALTPLHRLEHRLHPWVAWFIMPIFALANAGVSLAGGLDLTSPVTLGVAAGLVVGKPLGIVLFVFLAVRLGLARIPDGIAWRHLVAAGCLAGIGFTMSLFITGLAFTAPEPVAAAKIGILLASAVAGVVGLVLLRRATRT